jgi:hypothetical protein
VKALVPAEWSERRCICRRSGRRRQSTVPPRSRSGSPSLDSSLDSGPVCVGSSRFAQRGQSSRRQSSVLVCGVECAVPRLIQPLVLPQSTFDCSAIRVWSQEAGLSFFLYISSSPRAPTLAWTLGAPKGLFASPATPWAT